MSEATQDQTIVRAAIHPSIGIARIGNSATEWFYGPEVPDPPAADVGFYRDAQGALKRQAARFRIYGLNARDQPVAELTAANAAIRWTVHLANKKAAWYEFQLAQDIPEAASAPPQFLRNATVTDRAALAIDPGRRSIEGANQSGGREHAFDDGCFFGEPVYLGELRTDPLGRLIVLGGHGVAASHDGCGAITFANNDGWHDDTSDGPVTAAVHYQGKALEVDPAWVVVAPPNYAPGQKSVRTMWDLMRDLAYSNPNLDRNTDHPDRPSFRIGKPKQPSFTHDIAPIFTRLTQLQWVNAGFAAEFGWGAMHEFGNPRWLEQANLHLPHRRDQRRALVAHFRRPERNSSSPAPWPPLYGDAMATPPPPTPRAFVALSPTQLGFLEQWAEGDFVADHDPTRPPPKSLDEVAVADQPATLDRAALEFCLADAFHPGCEMTWPMRVPSLYMAPFRIQHARPDWIEPPWPFRFTPHLRKGPLFQGQVPGGITRWMGVPWQTDTASCGSAAGRRQGLSYGPYLPTFWPARVPNDVLSERDYDTVMSDQPLPDRLNAFATRVKWVRTFAHHSGYHNQINHFLSGWWRMRVVETRPGPDDPANFPPLIGVEEPGFALQGHADEADPTAAVDLDDSEKLQRFPNGLRPF